MTLDGKKNPETRVPCAGLGATPGAAGAHCRRADGVEITEAKSHKIDYI